MSKNKKPAPKPIPSSKGAVLNGHTYLGDVQGCGFIRVIIPNTLLFQKRHGNVSFMPSFNSKFILDKNFYQDKMFVVLQRSATKAHADIVDALKSSMKVKIFYEIDDNLMIIPEGNFANPYYQKNKPYIERILSSVDGIVTSTKPLKDQLLPYNKNITVSKNHLPKYLGGDIPEIKEIEGKPRILWIGSANHFALPGSEMKGGDIDEKVINFMAKTTDKYQGVFVGAVPNELNDLVKEGKIEFYRGKSIFEYPSFMKSLNAHVGLAPLLQHPFNKAKSNIKALEYTAAGIPGIYTNVYPYYGMRNACDTPEMMIDRIEMLCSDSNKRKEHGEHDGHLLKDQLFGEENDNLIKYVDSFLNLIGFRLPRLK